MVIGPVKNNLSSQIQRNLNNLVTKHIQSATERLASGLRVNRTSDDAAGIHNINRLNAQIEGYNAAINNAQSGINVSNIADQGLESITDSLQRVRVLSIQAGNSSIGQDGKAAIQTEINQQIDEINRVANSTQYTSNKLLNSSLPADATDAKKAQNSNIQVGSEPGQGFLLNFGDVRSQSLGLGKGRTVDDIDVTKEGGVSQSIQIVDAAIGQVGGIRSVIGSGVNRLTSTIGNLSVKTENLFASQSRIRDTDFAKTSTKLATSRILLSANLRALLQSNKINRDSVLGALQ